MEYCQPHYLFLLMLMEIIQGNSLPPGQLSWQLAAWWVECQSFQDIWFPSCSPGELLASQVLQLAAPQALQLGWVLPGVTEIKLSYCSLCWLRFGSMFILETLKFSQCFSSLDNINISLLSTQNLSKFAVSQWESRFVVAAILVFLYKSAIFFPNQNEEKKENTLVFWSETGTIPLPHRW